MAADAQHRSPFTAWRLAAWGGGAAILLVPAVAMLFTDEVKWDAADFAFAALLVLAVGGGCELVLRMTPNRSYRAAAAIGLVMAFLVVWANAAVGIIGSEDNPANHLFHAVLGVGLAGAFVARFRPPGMARAMVAMAAAQLLAMVFAMATSLGSPIPVTAVLTAAWLLCAWLFRKASTRTP